MKYDIEYGYSEIYLKPKKSIALTRKDCDTSVKFGSHLFKNGVIAANMSSVVNIQTCKFLASNNLFYIMHRFGVDIVKFTDFMHSHGIFASISIGVNEDSVKQLISLKNAKLNPEYITIDIANVYSVKGENMIKYTKNLFPESFLIAGNCATAEAVTQLEEWGADATKVGIANGHVCETYMATGFGRPQFSTILDCASVAKKPIIGDGGIRIIGDISKAFVAGATMVMAGNLFAGYKESAGEIIEIDGKRYKQYFGSASYNNTLSKKNVEGKCILIPYKGEMKKLLYDINDGLASAISYAGGLDMSAFNSVEWGIRNGGMR